MKSDHSNESLFSQPLPSFFYTASARPSRALTAKRLAKRIPAINSIAAPLLSSWSLCYSFGRSAGFLASFPTARPLSIIAQSATASWELPRRAVISMMLGCSWIAVDGPRLSVRLDVLVKRVKSAYIMLWVILCSTCLWRFKLEGYNRRSD